MIFLNGIPKQPAQQIAEAGCVFECKQWVLLNNNPKLISASSDLHAIAVGYR
jgi:hypothetical protein